MNKLFSTYLETELNIKPTDKILLAVSGGADSIVMLNLFSKANYNCGVAHCNFHLRGEESDNDEEFVKKLSKEYSFLFYKIDFNTNDFAKENGLSIEMAARELRYEWFEKIRQKFEYDFIATAHHKDDIIETFLINLTRKTGIRGLSGIKKKNGHIIRPMLFTNRASIMNYIEDCKLEYREDSTNSDIKIIRNRFRHQILPILKEINPAVEENILQTIENLMDAETIMNQKLAQVKAELNIKDKAPLKIEIAKLRNITPLEAYLYEILSPYGFNVSQIKNIQNSLPGEPGKTFYSKTHQIVKDRHELIIMSIQTKKKFPIYISNLDKEIEILQGRKLIIEKIDIDKNYRIPSDANIAVLDYEKLRFPLQIKEWEAGDYFFPLGMKQKKKLSDFFIDEKLSLIDKQEVLLLVSYNQIVWVIEKRIDDRFKITNKTKIALVLKLS